MEQAHKKRPPRATANSPPVLSDMGEFYFINLENFNIFYMYVFMITTTQMQVEKDFLL